MALFRSKPSSFRPEDLFSRLLISLRLVSYPRTSPEGVNVPSFIANVPDQLGQFPPEIDRSLPTDLRSLLPGSCEWLEQGALEVAGGHPVDAGGFADVRVGEMGDRKVAIKVYRSYSSSDCSPTYLVSGAYLRARGAPLTKDPSAEAVQRGTGVQSSQGPERSAVCRSVLLDRTPTGSRFRVHG